MRSYEKAIILASIIATTGQNALAQNTFSEEPVDWRAQFAGLDGVAITCLRTIERKYAERACQQLIDHASEALEKSGIPNVSMGTFYSRDPAPKATDSFNNPLNLTIYVRATDPDPLGMDIRMHASVSYSAAVEKDGSMTPRGGELLMWQNGTTGAGLASKLEPAIIGASKKRMDEILSHINESWQR
tara:strand:- start:5829 stop:6389 length:561 start_codon:yes stop_codon:yes gene_type:complete